MIIFDVIIVVIIGTNVFIIAAVVPIVVVAILITVVALIVFIVTGLVAIVAVKAKHQLNPAAAGTAGMAVVFSGSRRCPPASVQSPQC